ncbi:unnamed protein product, partial [Effrenium voratum]
RDELPNRRLISSAVSPAMAFRVLLFGPAREAVGEEELRVEVTAEGEPKVADLREALLQLPALKSLLPMSKFSVDQEMINDESLVISGRSEIALIPPISGG